MTKEFSIWRLVQDRLSPVVVIQRELPVVCVAPRKTVSAQLRPFFDCSEHLGKFNFTIDKPHG